MPNYRRVLVPGGTYFFTVNLRERHRGLLVEHIESLREAFRITKAARPFHLVAIAVLPDHLHCVWRLPQGDADNARRWAQIKGFFSVRLPMQDARPSRRIARREQGVWQRRYWEHLIRDEDDLRRHVDYVHINPVKHGHAARAVDWPHSSFGRWVARGVYAEDWAADPSAITGAGERTGA
ncbi:transposase [Pseudoxanthomonas sp. PXM01]|uniref:REP-associated tyrosine transposase n=1 Tax=Pseudoxanthomonas sp. PXM01 TaxID=2769295 RepID=UPI001782DACA|nr:transposase [Pseudoxanthomonas sp. PXM01]MBD9467993.1 transposase [Pseudoxanthomonas sp. PXM01]